MSIIKGGNVNSEEKGGKNYLVAISLMTLPGCALLLDRMRIFPGPLPSQAFPITPFLSALLSTPTVLCAAVVKAAFTSGSPAPGAVRFLEKMVTCFLAAVAMTMTANLPFPGICNAIGFILCHAAEGILFVSLREGIWDF